MKGKEVGGQETVTMSTSMGEADFAADSASLAGNIGQRADLDRRKKKKYVFKIVYIISLIGIKNI